MLRGQHKKTKQAGIDQMPTSDYAATTRSTTFGLSLTASEETPKVAEVGGKALSLIRCHRAGFRVPDGFVLGVAFFEPWIAQIKSTEAFKTFQHQSEKERTKDHCDAITAQCSSLILTMSQKKELDAAMNDAFQNERSSLLVAVRSSSPEEDLAKTSFAGGYETTLGVPLQDDQQLLKAIIGSFASVFAYRVVQYKMQNGIDILNPRIAVVVQKLVNADVSGVAFSVNPQNNCYDEAVISSNFGLGESVVSGVVTPDTFVVEKVRSVILSKNISQNKNTAYVLETPVDGGICEEKKDDPAGVTLTDEKILEVASLVSKVEEHMGVPADIEWAIEGGSLFLLQARPITTYIPLFPDLVTAPGMRKNLYLDLIVVSQGFSEPMSVLGLDVWKRMLEVGKSEMTHGLDGHVYEINGRQYINLSNLMGSFGGEAIVEKMSLSLGGQIHKALHSVDLNQYKPAKVAAKNHWMVWIILKKLFQMVPNIVRVFWNPSTCMNEYLMRCDEAFKRFGRYGSEEQRVAGPPCFDEAASRAMNWFVSTMPFLSGIILSFYSKWRLSRLFRGGENDVEDRLVSLNMDLKGNPTSEMGHKMLHLASFAEFQETESAESFLRKLQDKAYSDEFMRSYKEFLLKFGFRGMKEIDIATPRSYEDEADLFRRMKQIDVEKNQIVSVKERKAKAYEALLDFATRAGRKDTFQYYADILQRTGGYREHPKYMYVFIVAHLRRLALQLGKNFVSEDRLDCVEQIFDLNITQVTQAQQDPKLDLRKLVRSNKEPYEMVAHVHEWPAVIDSRGKILRAPPSERTTEGSLSGDPISPGTIRGPAKVLKSPYEKPLEGGEILVTRATEPSWTPIFINAAGVILEVGGPLQHGAIIAREYGIPCVSGLVDATKEIRDGDVLEVNGTDGVVKIVSCERLENYKDKTNPSN